MYLHQCAIPCLQYSCLENRMDGGAWEAAVHGVAKSWTRLSNFTHSELSERYNVISSEHHMS